MVERRDYPEFEALADAFSRSGTPGTPAEVHGALCGMLAVRPVAREMWLRQVLGVDGLPGEAPPEGELDQLLEQLYMATVAQLADPQFGLQLLLPDDEEGLDERTTALAKWCEGFLFGLGLVGVEDDRLGDGELREFVQDVSEISRVTLDNGHSDEQEEAYSELVEYIRMGVLLATTELGPGAGRGRLH
jgi:yecA family protein